MIKTTDEIYQEMRTALVKATGLALSDSGDMALRLQTAAAQLYALWVQADWLNRQCFPQTADGICLERHAQVRGLERISPAYAQGSILFRLESAGDADLAIDEGTVCLTAAGAEFLTTQAGTIPAGELSCLVPAQARDPGSAGNVPAGTILFMAEIPVGVAGCENPESFSGGREAETDEALRRRVLSTYQTLPNGANAAFYQALALSVDGVAKALVFPKARGLGTVDLLVSAQNGIPDEALLAQITDAVNAQREICVDVQILAPEAVPVTAALELKIREGYDYESTALAVRQALEGWFTGHRLGTDVLLAELGSLVFAVEGVCNYRFTAPTEDITIAETQLPTLEALEITQTEA